MHFALTQLSDTNDWKLDLTYLPDLNDDLLLINLAHYYEVKYTEGIYLCSTVCFLTFLTL